jgi:hypothetical protein
MRGSPAQESKLFRSRAFQRRPLPTPARSASQGRPAQPRHHGIGANPPQRVRFAARRIPLTLLAGRELSLSLAGRRTIQVPA